MKFIQLKSLRDLATLVSSVGTVGVVQHLPLRQGHLFFIIGGTLSEVFLYFVKLQDDKKGKYIVYNTLSGEMSFSQRVRTDPNLNNIPIIEIVNQDLLSKELVDTVNNIQEWGEYEDV